MTYIANSLTSANPAADLYTAMAAALTSAGFTLSDTQVISTRTHKVWKSAAANNSQALDWYLDVAYTTTGGGSVWLGAFEGYTSPNGLRGPYNAGSTDQTVPESTFYSRYGATGSALETNWTHITNNVAQIQVTTTAFAYWISITTDRVIAMTSVAATSAAYCGFFDMYTPWSNKIGALAYPLITCGVNNPLATGTSAHSGISSGTGIAYGGIGAAITRRPPVAAVSTIGGTPVGYSSVAISADWAAGGIGTSNVLAAPSSVGGSGAGGPVGLVDTGSSAYLEGPRGGRLQIVNTWATDPGITIGYLKDFAVFAGSAITRGDTCTISGATWTLSALSSNRCYGFKAA